MYCKMAKFVKKYETKYPDSDQFLFNALLNSNPNVSYSLKISSSSAQYSECCHTACNVSQSVLDLLHLSRTHMQGNNIPKK